MGSSDTPDSRLGSELYGRNDEPQSVDEAMAESRCRPSDPSTWPAAERLRALAEGWIVKVDQ